MKFLSAVCLFYGPRDNITKLQGVTISQIFIKTLLDTVKSIVF